VPYPTNYGGAIDVFYRMKALSELGVSITLHCFEYGRGTQSELEKYADKVKYYKRKKTIKKWLKDEPFIVATRDSIELLETLSKDQSPILFEGIHTTKLLNHPGLKDRIKFVRMHNIEHDYYAGLAHQAKGLKKKYYASEAVKLKAYEPILAVANALFAINESDLNHLKTLNPRTYLLPACAETIVFQLNKTEDYLLFHGNLSVAENVAGLKWLINNVYVHLVGKYKLIVAGKEPTKEVVKLCSESDIELVPSPSEEVMNKLIQKARIHVLHTEQSTGVKLKLINSLRSSGHLVVTRNVVVGTPFSPLCNVAKNSSEFVNLIKQNAGNELSVREFDQRIAVLSKYSDNKENCKIILSLLKEA
jgi:hypothetical protein